MTLTLSADGNSFTGTNLLRGETKPIKWSGKRIQANSAPKTSAVSNSPVAPGATPSPTTVVTPPVVAPPVTNPPVKTSPVPAPSTSPVAPAGAPAGDGKFYPLTNFDVRLDKVEVARDNSVHAFVTFKNPLNTERKIVATTIQSFLEDVDELAFSFGDITRATIPEPEPFNLKPILPGGGELKARFVLPTLKGSAPCARLS